MLYLSDMVLQVYLTLYVHRHTMIDSQRNCLIRGTIPLDNQTKTLTITHAFEQNLTIKALIKAVPL